MHRPKINMQANPVHVESGGMLLLPDWEMRISGVNLVFIENGSEICGKKSAFDAAFNIVGACAGPDTTLAQVGEFYGDDASEIAWQMSSMLRGSNAIALSYGFEERMFQYAASSGKDVVCSVEPETWDFVNGVFLQTSIKGLEMGFGDPAPLHTEYVDFAVNSKNLLPGLDIVIPKTDKPQRESIMREGNLRADGNI